MERLLMNGNVVQICFLLCIINGMVIHAIRAYQNTERKARRQSEPCDWGQEYVQATNCSCIKNTMSCVYDIPNKVPMSITSVIVRAYHGYDYIQKLFSDESWEHVEQLAIDTMQDMYFHGNSFSGLKKLQELTLTGMGHLISFGDIFLRNDSVPHLTELTVNPGPQQGKPEILLDEKSFTSLLKRPIKHLNFSNVLLVTVEDKLLELSLSLKVLNLSDTTIIAYPSSSRTHSQKGQNGPQYLSTHSTLNMTSQQENYFNSNEHRLVDGILNERKRKTTDDLETKPEPAGEVHKTQLINESFKLKTNYFKSKQHISPISIHSKHVTNLKQLQSRFITAFSSIMMKEETGPTLHSLDLSGAEVSWGPPPEDVSTEHNGRSSLQMQLFAPLPVNFLFTVENLFWNRFFKVDLNITGTLNLTGTPIYIKTMTARNNNAVVLNNTLILDENNPVVSIDVSYNKLQYIARTTLWCFKNLKRLNLSWNKLYQMERDSEFGQLFVNLTNLQCLDLAQNNISYLHPYMFRGNNRLEVLLLNNNELTTFAVDLNGLDSLQKLDLSNNKIKYFSDVQVQELSAYFDSRLLRNKMINFQFLLQGNPLRCTCKSKEFLKMILHYQKVSYSENLKPPKCSYRGDEITIDKDALYKAEYLCNRVKIIVTSTVAATVTCVVIGILGAVFCCRHKRRQKTDVRTSFLREFSNGNLRETYLAFIAMSGYEEDRGLTRTVFNFHNIVKQCLNTQKKLILTGNDFTPGFPIVSEAYRMIKAACVVIAFVSKSFCKSRYCMLELQETCKQDKPLILIFTEHIDEDLMTTYMLEVFKRCARGRIELTEDGEWIMSPSMDKLCEAMVQLAAEQYKHTFRAANSPDFS